MTRTTHRTARALPYVAACMLFAVLSAPASASRETSSVGHGLGFFYDPAKEVTLVGTVAQIVPRSATGLMGLHVLVSVQGETVDAHIGPYLSKQIQETLHAGDLIQLVGVHEYVRGKDFLLVRQLVYGGRQVTVRSERGLLVGTASHRTVSDSRRNANGGAQ
jgi:hypothetical protein